MTYRIRIRSCDIHPEDLVESTLDDAVWRAIEYARWMRRKSLLGSVTAYCGREAILSAVVSEDLVRLRCPDEAAARALDSMGLEKDVVLHEPERTIRL